jgi:hypothetical protein
MTVFFLQGTVGCSLVRHYCGDFLASYQMGWLSQSAGCGMETKASDCEAPKPTKDGGECCHDEVETLQVDHSLKTPTLATVDFVPFVLFVIFYVSGYFRLSAGYRDVAPSDYSPPHQFTHRRFRALLQVFRN